MLTLHPTNSIFAKKSGLRAMFHFKVLLTSLLMLTMGAFSVQACPSGSPQSTRYIRRDNNRCEGVVRQLPGESQTGPLRIISLITRGASALGGTLVLRIPRLSGSGTPELTVQDLKTKYLLDELDFPQTSSSFNFNLPTGILKKVGVALGDLRASAYVRVGNQLVFVPVILEQPGLEYEFVLFAKYRTSFPEIEISDSKGRIVYSNPRPNFRAPGEVFITWNGRKEPAGRYVLRIIAEQEQDGKPPQKRPPFIIPFEHNPNWLK
jgi:hypothetical protein